MKTKNLLIAFFVIFNVLFFACTLSSGSGGKSGNKDQLPDRSAGSRAGSYSFLEVGSVEVTQEDKDQWHTVTLQNNFTDPVVVMGPVSYNGKQPCTVRVRNIASNQFEFQIDEWDYLDGKHPNQETISYMVVEQGEYIFSEMVIEAKSITGITHEWTDVAFDHAFDDAPVVLAQCASYNGKAAVTTRLQNVSAAGFSLRLQEQEANEDYHPNAEQVCVIAFEQVTGGDTIIISHAAIDDTWQTIEFNPAIPCAGLFAQMQTYAGNNACALRYRNLTEAGCEIKVQEEQSADEETGHNAEDVGYVVLEEGVYDNYSAYLPPPENVQASDSEYHYKIVITWYMVEYATEYDIYRSEDNNGEYALIATTSINSYDDVNIEYGKVYYYKVKAVLNDIESDFSTEDAGFLRLMYPTINASYGEFEYKVVVSWDKIVGAASYNIYKTIDPTQEFVLIGSTDREIYNDLNVTPETRYYYIVKAVQYSQYESSQSNIKIGYCTGPIIGEKCIINSINLSNPSIAYNGQEYGVAWEDGNDINFMRLDKYGNQIGQILEIENCYPFYTPIQLIHTGNEFDVIWQKGYDGYGIFLARIDNNGEKIGENIPLVTGLDMNTSPSVTWNGTEYALTYTNPFDAIIFKRFDNEGTQLGSTKMYSLSDINFKLCSSKIIWSPDNNEYVIIWAEEGRNDYYGQYKRFFGRITADGNQIPATQLEISGGVLEIESIGNNYGIIYYETENQNSYYTTLDREGDITSESHLISPKYTANVDLRWNGSEYAVIYGYNTGSSYYKCFMLFDELFNLIHTEYINDNPPSADSMYVSMVYSGDEYAIVWSETYFGIYFCVLDEEGNMK
jgi:fibronectin type 3 domain-containing protein